jgi:hypothetical protein
MNEFDMKIAILNEFEVSIQEASPDFELIPPQKRFSVDDDHCVVDLLFYHHNMQCLIPVYFKFGDLHSDDIEWMKLNLQILEQYKVHYDDKKAIGLILCVQDNGEHITHISLQQPICPFIPHLRYNLPQPFHT